MTIHDVKRIFQCEDEIQLGKGLTVTVDSFLNIAGFKNAPDNPSKQDLHEIDGGTKGYASLIETGIYS